MQLFVRAQETHTLEVTGEETVGSIKTRVATLENLPEDEVICYYGGEPLENDRVVCTFAPEMATLDILGRVIGGKVHGSLARAGKVKGQTPKVDKQEKKKKKTGRARRRQQYNCWFKNKVAATMGGGRRRGPNANS